MATVAQIAASDGAARAHSDVRGTPLRWPSQELTKVATAAQIAAPPPQGTARSLSDVCGAPLRWPSQELTRVATNAQIAAPQGGGEVSKWSA